MYTTMAEMWISSWKPEVRQCSIKQFNSYLAENTFTVIKNILVISYRELIIVTWNTQNICILWAKRRVFFYVQADGIFGTFTTEM